MQYGIVFVKDRSTFSVLTFFFLLLSLVNSELMSVLFLLYPATSIPFSVSFQHTTMSKANKGREGKIRAGSGKAGLGMAHDSIV